MYEICRRIPAVAGQMFLLSTQGNDCLRMDLDVLAANATSENCIIQERDGVARWVSERDAKGNPLEITWSAPSAGERSA